MLIHPGKTITIKHIPSLAKQAYEMEFSQKNIVASFKKTGIWPVYNLVFAEEDFDSAYVTDRLMERDGSCLDIEPAPIKFKTNYKQFPAYFLVTISNLF